MKLTLTDLKGYLSGKTKEELVQEITAFYQRFPQLKDFYQIQGRDGNEVVQKYKKLIIEEFEGKGRALPKARLSAEKKAVSDFKKLTGNPELIADVMLAYVESVSSFNSCYNPDAEDFYTSPEDMFAKALAIMHANNLLAKCETRAQEIVKNATEGYGHYDTLMRMCEAMYGDYDG
jgi:hypothetical protein